MWKAAIVLLIAAAASGAEEEPALRLMPEQRMVMQLKDGKGFLRVRFEKRAGMAAPDIKVASIVEAMTGRQVDGGSLEADWDPKAANESLKELDLQIKTVSSGLPFSAGMAHLQYRIEGALHATYLFGSPPVRLLPIGSRVWETRQSRLTSPATVAKPLSYSTARWECSRPRSAFYRRRKPGQSYRLTHSLTNGISRGGLGRKPSLSPGVYG